MIDDDDDDMDGPRILIDFEQQITMVRIVEDIIIPSTLLIRAEVLPTEDGGDEDYEIAFAKVRFWLENVVTRCIAFGRTNQSALKMLISEDGLNNSGNLLMLTPGEPGDENLAILLQAKMSALGGGKLLFGSVEIKSNNLTGLRYTFVGSADEVLPSMAEWIGEHTYFEEPWWNRDDASTLDVIPGPEADLSKKPKWAYDLDFIANAIRPNKEVVIRPAFNPTVIDGGKDDE